MSSTSARATNDVRRAEESRHAGATLDSTLEWFFAARERMQAPLSPTLHLEPMISSDGQEIAVRVDVDGGRGSTLERILHKVSAIGRVLRELELAYPARHDMVIRTYRDGWSQKKLAELYKMSQSTMSGELGRGEEFLVALLRRDGVLG